MSSISSALPCNGCCQAHALSFRNSFSTATEPLEVVHCDIWGPTSVTAIAGFRYYVLFTDSYSRNSWIYFFCQKSELVSIFAIFKAKIESLLSRTIKTIHTDGGTELLPLRKIFPQISFQISCPHTPQQNGLVERQHRYIVELALASMFHAQLPQVYWPDIFESIVFIINRLPHSAVNFQISYTLLFHKDPDYAFLKVLGCLYYPCLRSYNSNKFQPRSVSCTFLVQ